MRLICLLLCIAPTLASSQVWEKSIAPGIVYRMEVDTVTPRVVHAFRYARDAASPSAAPQLTQGTVFERDDEKKGRDTLSNTIEKEGAIAGINGDYFPWTGDPLGSMVRSGELVSKPFTGRSAFAWGKNYSAVARLRWTASASFMGKPSIKIDGLNEMCTKDMVVLNTGFAGFALADPKCFQAVLEAKEALKPTGTWTCKVIATFNDESKLPVGKDQFVITATGKSMDQFQFLAKGEDVTLKLETKGLDWSKALNVIGGGPMIVTEGKVIQAWDAEDFNSEFANKRHPRTAVGSTKDGDIWFVQVEGRQALSAGATIDELGKIMARLGCVEALNLDGGGSSELALSGMIINRPSDGAERPLANTILLFGQLPASDPDREFVIQGRPSLAQGLATDYKVLDSKGLTVPLSQVIWSATGDAWIDQGGRLRALQAGKATLKAWINGAVATLSVIIDPPPASTVRK